MIAPRRDHPDVAVAQLPAQVVIAWPVTFADASAQALAATLEITIALDASTPAARCLLRGGGGANLRILPMAIPPTATLDAAADLLHLDGPDMAATIFLAGTSPRLLYARFRFGDALLLGPGAIEEPLLR